jgi:CDP-diacylglycerol--glycerol-3-phosphate 3-phosphatidyltransferase
VPSVYDLKPAFQAVLRPMLGAMVRRGVRPNHLTIAAVLGSMAAGLAVLPARSQPLWLLVLPGWLFVRMALNAMDGMAAREFSMGTPLGAVLNETGDAVSDVALYLPLALLRTDLTWPVVAFCFGALFTEFCGVLGQALGARRQYQGPMGKSDRALLVGAMALVGAFAPGTLVWWPALLTVATALTAWTGLSRLQHALRDLARGETS